MTEQEAIKWQNAFKKTYNGMPKEADEACDMAISALKEIQQYRAIEQRLADMFGGELSLAEYVDELEKAVTEPDKSHPVKRGRFSKEVPESIRNLPTAYDVDKVVEQLESCRDIMLSPTNKNCFGEKCKHSDCMACVFEKAIEIVKAGGTDEQKNN